MRTMRDRQVTRLCVGWVLLLSFFLLLQGSVGGVLKLATGRQDDLAHNGLHLLSGLIGLALLRRPPRREGARRFALGFGLVYLALGAAGWVWDNPLGVLPLGPADHIFHLAVGGLTLAVGVAALRSQPGTRAGLNRTSPVGERPARR